MPPKTEEQQFTIPELEGWPRLSRGGDLDGPYIVICYDDNWHTFDDVIKQMQKAVGCTYEKAQATAIEIDRNGRAIVFSGAESECERVAGILREIRLQVETDKAI